MSKRLAIISTHPIQYYAPYFRLLSQREGVQLKVFYTWGEDVLKGKYDPGFKKNIQWDIPLLDGYEYEFLENIAEDKGSHHFKGINNPDIISRVNDWKPDAIYIIGWSYQSHLKIIRHFKSKIPIIFRGDSTLLDEKPGFSLKKILRYIALNWIYRHIDIALYVGENNRKYYEKFGLKKKQLVYAPHAIDNKRFTAHAEQNIKEATAWRHSLGIGDNDVVFMYAGKLEAVKNPGLLLDAFQNIAQSNAHLVFVGNGHLEAELRERAKNNDRVHFVGFQNQSKMPVVYRLCDVFILPSNSETWGLAINEAMACGRVVIASDKCGGAIDLIANGENGFVFQHGDINSLQKAMSACVDKKENLEEMGLAGLKKIDNFSFERIVSNLELILSGI